jgi:hypothetical protein
MAKYFLHRFRGYYTTGDSRRWKCTSWNESRSAPEDIFGQDFWLQYAGAEFSQPPSWGWVQNGIVIKLTCMYDMQNLVAIAGGSGTQEEESKNGNYR